MPAPEFSSEIEKFLREQEKKAGSQLVAQSQKFITVKRVPSLKNVIKFHSTANPVQTDEAFSDL